MAVSTASGFRPGRKQSLGSVGGQYAASNPASYDGHHSASSSTGGSVGNGLTSHLSSSTPSLHGSNPFPSMTPLTMTSSTTSFTSGPSGTRTPTLSFGSSSGPGGAVLGPGAPVAANTIANKPAVAASSLYQACLTLLERLWRVPDFGEAYLTPEAMESYETPDLGDSDGSSTAPPSSAPPSPLVPGAGSGGAPASVLAAMSPVSQVWATARLGAPLCFLYNHLDPEKPLDINPKVSHRTPNDCKKHVAKFVMACQHQLKWAPDDIFTVSSVYLNDTNSFVKVVRAMNALLDISEARGLLTEPAEPSEADRLAQLGPADVRAQKVRELLDTERKYVQDLEVLQNYARALQRNEIVSSDTVHNLFGNLNILVDLQRRLLIRIEDCARKQPDAQLFGQIFMSLEQDFAAYEPFCANYAQALSIIETETPNLKQLEGYPGTEGCYLEPRYELPSFLIKPVQRVCRYPMLLEGIIKHTPPTSPAHQDLTNGLELVRRLAENVNETNRLQENLQLVKDLESRVEDWKGHNVSTFGPLLLSEIFQVSKSDTEREYHVYLFKKILLCCKEVLPNPGKKSSKSNSLLKQKSASFQAKKPKTTLQLKGRIFIGNVLGAVDMSKQGHPGHPLQIWWRGDVEQESFNLKCKSAEQLKMWQTAVSKLIDDINAERQQNALNSNGMPLASPNPMMHFPGAGSFAQGRRGTNNSANLSHFPQTPMSEFAPALPFSRADSQMSHHQSPVDDEIVEGLREGSSDGFGFHGRGTSMSGRLSDASVTGSAWRSDSPAGRVPMSRSSTGQSQHHPAGSQAAAHVQAQQQQQHEAERQLRKASSSRQLRQPGYTSGHNGYPRPPRPSESDVGHDTGQSYGSEPVEQMDHMSIGARDGGGSSNGNSRPTNAAQAAVQTRNRSASSPQAYLPNGAPLLTQPRPPMPARNAGGGSYVEAGPSASPIPSRMDSYDSTGGGHGQRGAENGYRGGQYAGSGAGKTSDKRFSSSSASTTGSITSYQSRPQSTAASSPHILSAATGTRSSSNATPTGQHGGSSSPHPSPGSGAAVRLQVQYMEDVYIVVVLVTVSFNELLEKVAKKVRVCSGNKNFVEADLRMRYLDEDGDRIAMTCDDDVQMAFETWRGTGEDVQLFVST